MEIFKCPKCQNRNIVKSGVVKERQRYFCKNCNYYFTVNKIGKKIDDYYVIKALQLYIEGLSYREIERLLGISHVTISNWVKNFKIRRPYPSNYYPIYKILNHTELIHYIENIEETVETGILITKLGTKFVLIKWERFRI